MGAPGRMYCCDFAATSETVAIDVFEFTPADDKPIAIHGFRLGQSSDFGDAQEEIIPVTLVRGHATSGSGGNAAANPPANGASGATSGFTFESGNTTQASAGTGVVIGRWSWNVRAGLDVTLTPEQRRECSQGNTLLVLRLAAAPADALTIFASADVEENG